MNDHIIINTIIIQKKRKLIFYLDTELSSIFAYSNMQPTDLINIYNICEDVLSCHHEALTALIMTGTFCIKC